MTNKDFTDAKRKAAVVPFSNFATFAADCCNDRPFWMNDIFYNGEKIYRFEAFIKFGSYSKMMMNPNIKLIPRKISL